MHQLIPAPPPSLAQRSMELRALGIPGASVRLDRGRELQYRFAIAPSAFGRVYDCLLRMRPDSREPEVLVLKPDLPSLAGKHPIPHIYDHDGPGTKLCLWWPKQREWIPRMKLTETCVPWTAEWLWYFEDWLATGEWQEEASIPNPRESGA
jgi:hypothetical protein